ncbi:MAG TPA: aspartate aminotransferase family protein [Nitrososphaerales archaeon]|nr:aspartate aminotransferase family protein [Nitrososphaerales archaeon]
MPSKRGAKQKKSDAILERLDKSVANSVRALYYPIVVKEAHDCTVTDVEGKSYLDFNASWTVAGTGYSNPEVAKAVRTEFDRNGGVAAATFPGELTARLAERLIELTPGKFEKKVWFGHSGSDACDAPFKMLPLATKRPRVLSFFGSMHGVDVGGMAMAGHPATSKYPIPTLVTKVPYAYCYRCPFGLEFPSCGIYCAGDFIEDHVFKYVNPPEDTSFVMVEPIQSDSGDIVPPPGYLEKLKETCDKHGILFVVDEVKVGFGRTGKMFATQLSKNVAPDGVSLGKSIASGIPVGAFVARRDLIDTGFALSTLSGNALGAAAGLATIDYIEKHRLPQNAAKVGAHLMRLLQEIQSRQEIVGDVRGKGLVIGIEFVKDRETKEPARMETVKIVYRAWQLGLLTVFVGADSNVMEITPPLTITAEAVERGASMIEQSIKDVQNGLVPDSLVGRFTGF